MPTSSPMDLVAQLLARQIKTKAISLGFDLVGIASAEPSRYREQVRHWLEEGNAGSMAYMGKRFEERINVGTYFPGTASVICVAMNYHVPLEPAPPEVLPTQGRVARYALGTDYHEVITRRLHLLADWLKEAAPADLTRCCVDTAPVLERELAARAGIGWIGKNTCVIHPRIGSWILLGEILTTLALPPDDAMDDHCGTCTRCIDACPTAAITSPYQIDSRRCISYLTIENRDEVSPNLQAKIGDWLYGCDICQEVCPHNGRAPTAIEPSMQPRFPTGGIDVMDVLNWTEDDYRSTLSHSAMKRTKLPILRRNAQTAKENLQNSRPPIA